MGLLFIWKPTLMTDSVQLSILNYYASSYTLMLQFTDRFHHNTMCSFIFSFLVEFDSTIISSNVASRRGIMYAGVQCY